MTPRHPVAPAAPSTSPYHGYVVPPTTQSPKSTSVGGNEWTLPLGAPEVAALCVGVEAVRLGDSLAVPATRHYRFLSQPSLDLSPASSPVSNPQAPRHHLAGPPLDSPRVRKPGDGGFV